MTKEETIKVLELLNAFYAGGKNDPKQQAIAWHLIIGKFDFEDAMKAVLHFAERDKRDYASMPGVGKIVESIEGVVRRREEPVREVIRNVQSGLPWSTLTARAKALIPEESYDKWLGINAEEFAQHSDRYADFLRKRLTNMEQEAKQLEAPER